MRRDHETRAPNDFVHARERRLEEYGVQELAQTGHATKEFRNHSVLEDARNKFLTRQAHLTVTTPHRHKKDTANNSHTVVLVAPIALKGSQTPAFLTPHPRP